MYILNITNPITLILILTFTVLMIYLGMETKKSYIPAISLGMYLILIIIYVVQFITIDSGADDEVVKTLTFCMATNFILILISYIGYLWIDDVETKLNDKKSISSDLDWLWKKV